MQLFKAGFFVFAVFSSAHATDMTSGACEGDTCAASDDEVALLQTAVEVKELSRHGGTGSAATKATFGWTCSPLDNGALKAPTNEECETWAGLMSDALGKTFHCDSYGPGTYGQPGPFLRNTPQCSSMGSLWDDDVVFGPFTDPGVWLQLNCRGHMNDGWAGPGRFVQLTMCSSKIALFNQAMDSLTTPTTTTTTTPAGLPACLDVPGLKVMGISLPDDCGWLMPFKCDSPGDFPNEGTKAKEVCEFCGHCAAGPTTTTTTTTTTMAPVAETPECSATPNWHAGYGSCDTYTPGLITNGAENYAYCDMDKSRTGVMASETCEECGTCYRLPSCASVANWHAGYGSCDTYVEGLITNGAENYAYCDQDKSRTGVTASEACEECGQCSISNPSTLAATSTSAPEAADAGSVAAQKAVEAVEAVEKVEKAKEEAAADGIDPTGESTTTGDDVTPAAPPMDPQTKMILQCMAACPVIAQASGKEAACKVLEPILACAEINAAACKGYMDMMNGSAQAAGFTDMKAACAMMALGAPSTPLPQVG